MLPIEREYLKELDTELKKMWPENKTVNIVCHGHSIPCGYTVAHVIRRKEAYPELLHDLLCRKYPTAVTNVIVSAVGGENSVSGAARFKEDVLCCKPRLVTIDYGRNDMYLKAKDSREALRRMTEEALTAKAKVLLLTPFIDCGEIYYKEEARQSSDEELSEVVRELAAEYGVGLADVRKACLEGLRQGVPLSDYLISVNHPDIEGHRLIASQLIKWFPFGI